MGVIVEAAAPGRMSNGYSIASAADQRVT